MKRKKRIKARVSVDESGNVRSLSHENLLKFEDGWRDILLVEHEPAADAVVRAAIYYVNNTGEPHSGFGELSKAVERLEKRRAK